MNSYSYFSESFFHFSFIFGTDVQHASCAVSENSAEAVLIVDENDNPPKDAQGMLSILLNSQSNFFVEGLLIGDQ